MKLISAAGIRSALINPFKIFVGLANLGCFTRMDDERYLKLLYRGVVGRPLHLNPPVLYSEKIQWLKIHEKNPAYPMFCDKLAVRDFVKERAGEQLLTELYGVWDRPDQIDFSALPDQFVLKCTHDSGSAIICRDKSTFDTQAACKTLEQKLRKDYSISGREWPYHDVPRRILAEEYLTNSDGTRALEFKFFCFHGKAKFLLVRTNEYEHDSDNFTFLRDFTKFQIYRYKMSGSENTVVQKPSNYEEMIRLAEKLSCGFVHIRVDLYQTPKGIKFGEQTLYNASGLSKWMTLEGDRFLGELLRLENVR